MVGVPAVSGPVVYAIGAVGSAVAWWLVGSIAGRRAAKRAVADWSDWRREMLPFALGISLGGIVALVLGTVVLGTF
jgi:prepilin signal peptidase PulO-like enzyme (type II secretory pathway)